MFNTKDTNPAKPATTVTATPAAINIIGQGTQIDGEIKSENDIRVDGKVKGTITSKSKIVVGTTGIVDGDLICDNADISGKVFGKVEVGDMMYLKSSGYLEGDIVTGKLVVEAGARFTGSCKMGVKEIKPSEKITPQQLQKKPSDSGYFRFATFAYQIIGTVALGFLAGYFLDKITGWSFPLFKVVCSFGAVFIVLYLIIKQGSKNNK